ncbi:MAG: hypothetical protein QQN63_12250 [Nitrosopumilus sp.]
MNNTKKHKRKLVGKYNLVITTQDGCYPKETVAHLKDKIIFLRGEIKWLEYVLREDAKTSKKSDETIRSWTLRR